MSVPIGDQFKQAYKCLYVGQDGGTYDMSIPLSLQFTTTFNGGKPQNFILSHPEKLINNQQIYNTAIQIIGLPASYNNCFFRIISYQNTYSNKVYTTKYKLLMYYKKRARKIFKDITVKLVNFNQQDKITEVSP